MYEYKERRTLFSDHCIQLHFVIIARNFISRSLRGQLHFAIIVHALVPCIFQATSFRVHFTQLHFALIVYSTSFRDRSTIIY